MLADSKGEPYEVKKAICIHEVDDGLLWKHVEYRNGHSESRRSRKLVISSICTVVNYEYLVSATAAPFGRQSVAAGGRLGTDERGIRVVQKHDPPDRGLPLRSLAASARGIAPLHARRR